MKRPNLSKRPELLRSSQAVGLSTPRGDTVDPAGGSSKSGLIRGFAIVTRGEALGHGYWLDETFLQQVAAGINAAPGGVKSRFTHPGLSSDGLAKYLGKASAAYIDGDTVRGVLEFSKSAHKTPDGDLAGYVLARASESPDTFGASIVFERDDESIDEFIADNGGEWLDLADGGRRLVGFASPDPLNLENLPHARVAALRAVDIVDDPAANPGGMFHRGDEIAGEAEQLASYVLGLTSTPPVGETQLGIDPERASAFVDRFLSRHGLEIVPKHLKGESMESATAQSAAVEAVEAEALAAAPETMPGESAPAGETEPACTCEAECNCNDPIEAVDGSTIAPLAAGNADGMAYLAAFGDQGARWYVEGKSFAEAQTLYAAQAAAELSALRTENEQLRSQLTALRGEPAPVSFSASDPVKPQAAALSKFKNAVGSDGLAAFAASIELPAKK